MGLRKWFGSLLRFGGKIREFARFELAVCKV